MPDKAQYSIGVDIGGTKMAAVLFDLEKKVVISNYELATPKDSLDSFLVMLWALIDPLIERAKKDKVRVERVGIGSAGMMEQPAIANAPGKLLVVPNLKILENVELGKLVQAKYQLATIMDNDVNCFLLAEMKLGAVQKSANVFGVAFGTGIGGAFSIDHRIFRGVHGSAGEIGYMIADVIENEPRTLEEVYHDLMQSNPVIVAEQAYEGDQLAEKIYQEVGRFIGLALANIVNLIDPEIIVLGGSLMKSSDLFLREVKNNFKTEVHSPKLKKIKIVPGKVARASAVGAALLNAE